MNARQLLSGPRGTPAPRTSGRRALRAIKRPEPASTAASRDKARLEAFSRAWLPKLLAQQEAAARASRELSVLEQWASELGSKARRALAHLVQAAHAAPLLPGAGGEARALPAASSSGAATPGSPPDAGGELDLAAAFERLEAIAAAADSSNDAFAARAAALGVPDIAPARPPAGAAGGAVTGGAGGGAGGAGLAERGEAALESRQRYLRELLATMEEAEAALLAEEAAREAAAADAAERAERGAAAAAAAAAEAALAERAAAGAAAAAEAQAHAAGEGQDAAADAGDVEAPGGVPLTMVDFAVRCCTQPGQDVVLVGSHPAIGSWDLGAALPLQWTDGHVWRASVELDAAECPAFEYKAVLKCAGGGVVWEGGANRAAEVEGATAQVALFHEFVRA